MTNNETRKKVFTGVSVRTMGINPNASNVYWLTGALHWQGTRIQYSVRAVEEGMEIVAQSHRPLSLSKRTQIEGIVIGFCYGVKFGSAVDFLWSDDPIYPNDNEKIKIRSKQIREEVEIAERSTP